MDVGNVDSEDMVKIHRKGGIVCSIIHCQAGTLIVGTVNPSCLVAYLYLSDSSSLSFPVLMAASAGKNSVIAIMEEQISQMSLL